MTLQATIAQVVQELMPQPAHHKLRLDAASDNAEDNYLPPGVDARLVFWCIRFGRETAEWTAAIVFHADRAMLCLGGTVHHPRIYHYCDPAFPQNLADTAHAYYQNSPQYYSGHSAPE